MTAQFLPTPNPIYVQIYSQCLIFISVSKLKPSFHLIAAGQSWGIHVACKCHNAVAWRAVIAAAFLNCYFAWPARAVMTARLVYRQVQASPAQASIRGQPLPPPCVDHVQRCQVAQRGVLLHYRRPLRLGGLRLGGLTGMLMLQGSVEEQGGMREQSAVTTATFKCDTGLQRALIDDPD